MNSDRSGRGGKQPDPTKVLDQPALRTSHGAIWLVMGGLFAAAALVPFVLLIVKGGPSAELALATAVVIVALYAAMLALRFAVARRVLRLRLLMACLLSMAAISLISIWAAGMLEEA